MTVLLEESGARATLLETEARRARRICFVCTGNTCRSPMAQAVANHLAQTEGIALEAFSAGLYAKEGDPITDHAVRALEEAGIASLPGREFHAHLAHTLTEEEAKGYDLMVGMTPTHVFEMTMRYPALVSRIRCMPSPISDPFGGDLSCYRACLAEILTGVRALFFPGETT